MTRETYLKLTAPARENKKVARLLTFANRILSTFVIFLYLAFLLLLFAEGNPFLPRAILVPAVSFAAVSIFRAARNAPRPYETFGIPPALKKSTKGKSFPSRHVFSIYVIATTVFCACPTAGLLLFALGVVLAAFRVIGGVHWPRDVIAGALIGVACGLFCYL